MTEQGAAVLAILLAAAKGFELIARHVRRKAGAERFTPEEAGRLKEQVQTLDREIQRIRTWRHGEYTEDISAIYRAFLPRTEADILAKQSAEDRRRLWAAVERLERRSED